MGRPKATLAVGDGGATFLSRLIRTFEAVGIPDIVIVTGAHPDAVRAAAGPARGHVRFVHNADWERGGQLSSLLAALRDDDTIEALMMTLVDAPFVAPATVAAVLHRWRSSGAPIVRPSRGEEHGHPVIFDRALFPDLRAADPAIGAKAVVRAREPQILNVPVEDPGAFVDVDTVDQYRAALVAYGERR